MRYAKITDRLAHTGGARWAVHFEGRRRKAAGEDMIVLTIGEPDLPPEPRVIDACVRALRDGRTRYSNGRGEPATLEAISALYARRRPGVGPRNVLCLPGTQTALYAAFQALVGPGDGVLVGDPYYATYDGAIAATGAHRISVPLRRERGYRLAAEDVERAAGPDARVLLLNTPHNPTGAVLSARDVAEIGEVARAKDLWILSDEVYRDLVFDGSAAASPFDDPALAERVIAAASISKSHAAPGFRSGWLVGPEDFVDRLLPVVEAMLFGSPPFIADATAAALAAPSEVADAMRDAFARRARLIETMLASAPGLRVNPPAAGMFVTADVAGTGMDGDAFAAGLLEHGVAVMPGGAFGETGGDLIRISVTEPDEALEEACRRILRFVTAATAAA
jgi:arginine:pyruvate transaminase